MAVMAAEDDYWVISLLRRGRRTLFVSYRTIHDVNHNCSKLFYVEFLRAGLDLAGGAFLLRTLYLLTCNNLFYDLYKFHSLLVCIFNRFTVIIDKVFIISRLSVVEKIGVEFIPFYR